MSGSNVFVIADLHFGHAKLAQVRGFDSKYAHDDALVAAWNRTVRTKDVVYVLGDVFSVDRVAELNGCKKLALGNHDQRPASVYANLFSQVRACFEFDGCILTHIPVHPSQLEKRYELNVHGHTHAHALPDLRYVPTSVEHCHEMQPLPLRGIIETRRKWIAGGGA